MSGAFFLIKLMNKVVDIENSPVLYETAFSKKELTKNWDIKSGEWWYKDGWLNGRNPGNFPGMVNARKNFPGNVLVEFEARTVTPCTHDINFMWNGSWNEETNTRDIAYVAGLEGWWEGKVGIEKSPQYLLNAGTGLFEFDPQKTYFIQGGSIDGHCFICADKKLLLEITDPDPIDNQKYVNIGFEAYCSWIQIRNVVIRQIKWDPRKMNYKPEF
jgi:hypothetical protein